MIKLYTIARKADPAALSEQGKKAKVSMHPTVDIITNRIRK